MALRLTCSLTALLALTTLPSATATEELTPARFQELTTSGRNGMIKFYQVRCGYGCVFYGLGWVVRWVLAL